MSDILKKDVERLVIKFMPSAIVEELFKVCKMNSLRLEERGLYDEVAKGSSIKLSAIAKVLLSAANKIEKIERSDYRR